MALFCTEPMPTNPGCHNALFDVAFIIDGSTSVGENNFALLRDFLYKVINEFQDVSENGIKIALLQYSDEPRYQLLCTVNQF